MQPWLQRKEVFLNRWVNPKVGQETVLSGLWSVVKEVTTKLNSKCVHVHGKLLPLLKRLCSSVRQNTLFHSMALLLQCIFL